MAKDRSGAGDPARTLELLWRESGPEAKAPGGRRGPRQGLSVDAVVLAATALADEEGLAALTMRALAQRLGVTPMTLYTYVPGKAELLDLMLDGVYLRMQDGKDAPDSAGAAGGGAAAWAAQVTRVAEDNRALFARHPWVADLAVTRPPLGPGVIGKYERELAAFEGIGLTDPEMDAALSHLLGFVHANALAAADAAAHNSGLSDEEWWAVSAPLLERVMAPGSYPLGRRVGSAVGAYDPEAVWTFGLQCVLDGLARLVEGRRAQDGAPRQEPKETA
ncbi:TetR/AcrR family transcriptional regulator [Streptomyces sp. NPDC058662]|uniref:TetR/AcrR family transcriptional regulator n=1 Tax=Streptomyces sp. NPDC058662 TaxID=3346583 RepID=UPI00364B7556